MKRYIKTFGLACAFFFPFYLFAQDFSKFEPLKCTGTLPDDFVKTGSQKAMEENEVMKIDQIVDKREKSAKNEFVLSSSYLQDKLLKSGRVLFNDPISEYLNFLKDYILRDQPELMAQVRIYVVKSNAVNAFANNNGVIFFTVGLLSHLKTEAEVAFVLCHEIQHFIHKHPLKKHIENGEILSGSHYSNRAFEEKLIEKNQYSREQETEADTEGFKLFLQTQYELNAYQGVFDALQYSYLPFGNAAIDKNFFEKPFLFFPDSYWPDSINPISPREDFDSVLSTHPSIDSRRAHISEFAESASKDDRMAFIFGEEKFLEMRNLARFESVWLSLSSYHFEDCIYSCFLLLKEFPNNPFLLKCKAHAIYSLSRYKNEGYLNSVHYNPEKIQGESHKLVEFIDHVGAFELNVLALEWCQAALEIKPGDIELLAIRKDLLHDLFYRHSLMANGIEANTPGDPEKIIAVFKSINPASTDKSKKEQTSINRLKTKPGCQFGLVHHFGNEDFTRAFQNARDSVKPYEKPELSYYEYYFGKKSPKYSNLEYPRVAKMMLLDPFTFSSDERKKPSIQYAHADQMSEELRNAIEAESQNSGVNFEFMKSDKFNSEEIEKFNEYATVMEYLSEFFAETRLILVNSHFEEMKQIREKYGISHLTLLASSTQTYKKRADDYLVMVVCCLWVPPIFLLTLFKDFAFTTYYFMLIDLEKELIDISDKPRKWEKYNSKRARKFFENQFERL